MQTIQLHKKSISKLDQKIETVEEIERRENERIRGLVSSGRMFRLEGSNVFYIESSSQENIFHYTKMNFTT